MEEDVTRYLSSIKNGKLDGSDELMRRIYAELRRIAATRLAMLAPGQTLQATALVHEAWIKMMGSGSQSWESRRHFFNAAAEAMRHILIDTARRKSTARRGGANRHVDVDEIEIALPTDPDSFIVIHEALEQLAAEYPLKAEIVKLKYFIGLENREAADLLGIPVPTLERQWSFARAWLKLTIETAEAA